MGARDERVDAYIENAAAFAQPILRHLRKSIHTASPDIDETMKWGMPHFVYNGIICSMAAFKQHCAFGFWKESLILGGTDADREAAMGQFGRIASIADLPARDVLIDYVRKAVALNESGVKAPRSTKGTKKEIALPAAFRAALDEHPAAAAAYSRFSPSQRREYVEWIAEAKREDTRARRISTAVEWIAEGKSRNWKYSKRKQ